MIRLFNLCCVLFLAFLFVRCDSELSTDSEKQYVKELQWLPNGSSLLGFVQYFVSTVYDPDPGQIFDITKIESSGKIGAAYNTKEPAYSRPYYDIQLALFPTSDNTHVLAQLGQNIYRVDLGSGAEEKLILDFHLTTVSPDGRFVVGTHSQKLVPRKSIYVYDLSGSTARKVVRFDVDDLSPLPGVWLRDGQFAITLSDSVGRHIDVYDTTGALKHRIGFAATPMHNTDYIRATNHLYYQAGDGSIGMIDLTTGNLAQPIHFQVQNFDVTNDEKSIYYSTGVNGSIKRYDQATSVSTEIASGVFWGVVLSPDETKAAYVYEKRIDFQEVKVITLP